MHARVSVFQITLLFLYGGAGIALAASRLPRFERFAGWLVPLGFALGIMGVVLDARILFDEIVTANNISLWNTVSLIGLQLGLIGLIGAVKPQLRGLCGSLLILAGLMSLAPGLNDATTVAPASTLSWQMRTHVSTSLFAYALLTAGVIVAIFALVQERRLRNARLPPTNQLFAPLETTENLLALVTAGGFVVLALSVISGFTFVEDLFAQHLVHKTALSLLALVVFGVLLAGRQLAGWRGRRAVYLYLAGFALLCLAYFGSRIVLEELLGRSWS